MTYDQLYIHIYNIYIYIYDQEFIDNWYSILKDFSLILMKQIVGFCEKTEEKTQTSITEIGVTLKQKLKKDDYAEIQNTFKVNETATKQILHQRKFKKFNTLKYKPKPTVKTTNFTEEKELLETSPTTARPTYADILKDTKNPSIKTSKTNFNNKNIHEKLRSLSSTIRTRKQGNIPSRNNSNTNMVKDDKYQQELNELKEEIKILKQSKKQQHDPKTEIYKNNIILESKNENTDSVSHGDQQENVQLITVINFIEQTMKTLSNYGEQLKTQLDFNLTQQDK